MCLPGHSECTEQEQSKTKDTDTAGEDQSFIRCVHPEQGKLEGARELREARDGDQRTWPYRTSIIYKTANSPGGEDESP